MRVFPCLFCFALAITIEKAAGQPATNINYDESKVGALRLPDLFPTPAEKTKERWMKVRRREILRLFQQNVYGKMPGKPTGMWFRTTVLNDTSVGGKAICKQTTIFFTSDTAGPRMDVLLYLPKQTGKKAPVFTGLNFYGNQTITHDPAVRITDRWVMENKKGVVAHKANEASRGLQESRWPVKELIEHGYGLATAYYGDLESDYPEGWRDGVRGKLSGLLQTKPDEWAAIGVWAWGLSRMLDYLQTEPGVDAQKVIVSGHSRLGKAAFWAGAADTRFAAVVANESGEGGAALARRDFGETIERINTEFPHWFVPAYKGFNNKPESLPVDQHMLLALIAPRPLYIASAAEDLWADPKGEFLSAVYASPVYKLFGKEGLGTDQMPPVDTQFATTYEAEGTTLHYTIGNNTSGLPMNWWNDEKTIFVYPLHLKTFSQDSHFIFFLTFNRMKRLLLFLFLPAALVHAADTASVSSPNKKISLKVDLSSPLRYSVFYDETMLLLPSDIDLVLANGKSLNADLRTKKIATQYHAETFAAPVAYQRQTVTNVYNELTVQFRQPFSVVFRVYNDGVAYRIVTRFKDSILVANEKARFVFPQGKKVFLPLVKPSGERDRFHTSFESLYPLKSMDSLGQDDLAYTPVLAGTGDEIKVGITESDLEDYPGMFLSGTGTAALQGVFAPCPLREEVTSGEFPQAVVRERADYIARTKGARSFPWRVLLIGATDKDLPANDLVYRLASPNRIGDASWIHPGKGTDEWIIGTNLFNVPFKTGVNTDTYKFYIDFAARFGFQRIMMDAGWSSNSDLFQLNPDINMDTITAYARKNGVKLSMWTLAPTLDRQLDSALDRFNRWGVDFIMTDFMDRDDQKMVNFYYRIAKACADHKLMVMFHGAFPPKGLNRTYPNVMTTEGVLGSEYNIWSSLPTPEHDVTLPFTRMLGGPLDYEPGFLDNATKAQFRPIELKPMSQGTRCHQLAMFVVYDNPVQFFSGNPSQGLREPAFMELLGSIPTVWDETNVLEAKVGDYLVTGRKKGREWYIAGMTDWTEREFDLSLNFLEPGNYKAVLCADGVNADRYAADYTISQFTTNNNAAKKIKLAPGGGFLLKLTKQ